MQLLQLARSVPNLNLHFVVVVDLLEVLLQADFASFQRPIEQRYAVVLLESGFEILEVANQSLMAVVHAAQLGKELSTLGIKSRL